ncbi:brassinosteroid LRR receptor kinase-like [Impatiens glandulifera]|uniref:brassinosteroid LRR receptor kinase-like n=1 Tax=Impatiens glandulifera TaxID=253017 RepID=UPI001FB0F2FC|nr:brassinosteroid LRR receptor kinase-like [Impatiens glandulifera]
MKPFLFLHLLLLFFLLLNPSSSSSSITDSQLLLSFKSSLPSPNPLQNWLETNSPCNFSGITCRSSTVTAIDLSYVQLNVDFSMVSSSILSISNLERLTLKGVNLTGSVSSAAKYRCTSALKYLDLADNGISGHLSDLSSLAGCSGLGFLNMSKNGLVFGDLSVGFKLKLEVLDLSYNSISGSNLLVWLVSGGCSNLKYLSLKGNWVTGDVAGVGDCENLEHLDISSNNFTSGFPPFESCLSLKYLDISSNKFSGNIAVSLSSCKSLSFLNMSSNMFNGTFPAISGGKLESLHMSGCGVRGELSEQMIGSLCSSLIELDISSNSLYGSLPESFSSCSVLERLNLSINNFTGDLPIDTFLKMNNLKSISLAFNSFVGNLPDGFSNMISLEILDLSSNSLSGIIPPGLCQNKMNPQLKTLSLQNNQFTGPIPETISNCSELETLDLSFNYLTGIIPSSLGSLSKLKNLILWLNQLHGEIPEELKYIQPLENLILNFNQLSGEIPSGLSNCKKLNWISLSNNHLTGEIPATFGLLTNLAILELANNSISGTIPTELGNCSSLLWLDLNSNLLSGEIPPVLFKQSGNVAGALPENRFTYIKNDGSKQCHGAGSLLEFAGIRAEQLNRLSSRHPCNFTRLYFGKTRTNFNRNGSMIFLDLSYNTLTGSIPKELSSALYLTILNLAHNNLTGAIPPELGNLKSFTILDLSYNMLNGSIPHTLSGIALSEVDLSNNNLSGLIPQTAPFDTFPDYRFANNSGLCGYPLSGCGKDPFSNSSQKHKGFGKKQVSLLGSAAIGLLIALFCVYGLVLFVMERKKRRKDEEAAIEVCTHNSGTANTSWKLTGLREALSINLATFEKPLKKLTFADLMKATNDFHNDSIIGSGGFGDVYKAQLKDGMVVAIKKLIHISGQGDREFTAEMETIGKIKHRNLVPLLGYCKVGEERLLVYEFMKYGSLDDVLHDRKRIGIKLNWAQRRRIAMGAARGLAFLHHNCSPNIIHRDMKSSNVLVDEDLEARVSDFGMARLMSAMDTHLSVSTLAGTPGYVPPEYYQSFRCSTKGDVYSYGVVLLELLTGRQPTDSLDFGDNNLVGWVKLHAKTGIIEVFDPELLKDDPGLKIELLQHLKLACACLDDRPWRRPTMIQVMAMFKEIQAGPGIDSSATKISSVAGMEMSCIKEGNDEPGKN